VFPFVINKNFSAPLQSSGECRSRSSLLLSQNCVSPLISEFPEPLPKAAGFREAPSPAPPRVRAADLQSHAGSSPKRNFSPIARHLFVKLKKILKPIGFMI